LLINATKHPKHRNRFEHWILKLCKSFECCEYHRQVRIEMLRELEEQKLQLANEKLQEENKESINFAEISEYSWNKFLCCTKTKNLLRRKKHEKMNQTSSSTSQQLNKDKGVDVDDGEKDGISEEFQSDNNTNRNINRNTSYMSLSNAHQNDSIINIQGSNHIDIESAIPGLLLLSSSSSSSSMSSSQFIQCDDED